MEQFKHLIYKEWIKTKWFTFISLLLSLGVMIYIFVTVRSGFLSTGGMNYLTGLMTYKIQYFALYRYIPLAVALFIGLSQFVPEVIDKRIKLSLHLPVGHLRVIYSMVFFGFILLFLIQVLALLLFCGLVSFYLPWEILWPSVQTMLPWIIGGFAAYFLIAMIAMEPVWKFRVLYILVSYKILTLFFTDYSYANAVSLYPVLIIITLIAGIAPVYTSYRFNKGEL